MATLLDESRAETVKLKAVPGVAVAGAVTKKCVAVPELTVMLEEVPVMEEVTVSVAVTVCVPRVFKVTEKVPEPFVRVAFAGNTACPSVLVKWTVPA